MRKRFDVALYLHSISSMSKDELIKEIEVAERLSKKIDVVKIVYKYYSHDLSKKDSDEEIDSQTYLLLWDYFILLVRISLDIKFLNSSLKLNDLLMDKKLIKKKRHEGNIKVLEEMLFLWEQGQRRGQ